MTCQWISLPAFDDDSVGHCGKPGFPYCDEHTQAMDYLACLDNDFKEIEAPANQSAKNRKRRGKLLRRTRRLAR